MNETDHAPGFLDVGRRLFRTTLGALENRTELFSVELQEERARLLEILFWTIFSVFLAVIGLVILTGVIIFLFPENARIYAAIGFGFLYLIGAVAALFGVKSFLKNGSAPFTESLNQLKKDRECLESSE